MKFWASDESFRDASDAITKARRCVEAFLNAAFAASNLASLEIKLRYVPIIMPAGMRERYPARSKVRKKERIYDCAPQLNYEVFVEGTFEDQLREYLRGIAETSAHLTDFGATPTQVGTFDTIIATAVERILVERPDQTRH